MSEPTTEQKRAALIEAGKRIRANASEDEINMAFLEMEAEREVAEAPEGTSPTAATGAHNPATPSPQGAPGGIPSPPPETPSPDTSEVSSANHASEDIEDVIARVGDIHLGDRAPEVIAWARQNLSREDFAARYAGRI